MDLDQLKESVHEKSVGVAHRGIAGHLALRSGEPGSSRACLPGATAVVRWTPSSHWSQWVSLQGSHSWHGVMEWEEGSFQRMGILARRMVESGRVEKAWWATTNDTPTHTHCSSHLMYYDSSTYNQTQISPCLGRPFRVTSND